MPIKNLQRRQAELGRIRLGQKQATQSGKTRPAKLDRFRFTSVSEQYIRDLAKLYGGTAKAWDNNGVPSWEVITTATSVPVIVVKNGLSQWMETWSGGGCVHRCDGEVNVLTGEFCNPDDRDHVNAKPTTRLSVMLPELDAIGSWRLESHGWNAAAELPTVAELAEFVADLVPAVLHLQERRAIKDGQTSRFVVPVLDLQIGASRLRELAQSMADGRELGPSPASGAAAIESGRPDYAAMARAATTPDELNGVWHAAKDAGHMDQALGDLIREEAQRIAGGGSDEDEAVEGELVELPSKEQLWDQCIAAAAALGLDLWKLENRLESDFDVTPPEATAEHFADLLESLRAEAAA